MASFPCRCVPLVSTAGAGQRHKGRERMPWCCWGRAPCQALCTITLCCENVHLTCRFKLLPPTESGSALYANLRCRVPPVAPLDIPTHATASFPCLCVLLCPNPESLEAAQRQGKDVMVQVGPCKSACLSALHCAVLCCAKQREPSAAHPIGQQHPATLLLAWWPGGKGQEGVRKVWKGPRKCRFSECKSVTRPRLSTVCKAAVRRAAAMSLSSPRSQHTANSVPPPPHTHGTYLIGTPE